MLVYNRQIINFTKTRKWVRLWNIHPTLNESITEQPHIKEEFLCQDSLYRNSHKKLVWTIWKTGLGRNVIRWQPGTQRHAAASTSTRGATSERPKQSNQKKKRRKGGQLIPGRATMQRLIRWYWNDQANKDKGKGQKRNDKSVAEEGGGKRIATRIDQPPRKRGESGNTAFKL